jgi:hypothetical protein
MALHDAPPAADLAAAVEDFLRTDVMPAVDGPLKFQALVAANVMAIIGRELTLGAAQELSHAARLAGLGVADDAGLAAAIRSGAMDERFGEIIDALRQSVADKVAVANPKWAR